MGAWVGFVAAKIRISDWNEQSRSAAASRFRTGATVGGALIGVSIGSLSLRGSSCGAARSAGARGPKVSQAGRPITAAEIERAGINGSAYDLVYTLRPTWLNLRGLNSSREAAKVVTVNGQEVLVPGDPELMVYLDNVRLGTISELRNISAAGVLGVRYFDGPQATFRWGAGHARGAIQVLTVTKLSP